MGEVRRESFRCQQPSPITGAARGAAGRGEGPGLLGFLPCRGAAQSAVPDPAEPGRWAADGVR